MSKNLTALVNTHKVDDGDPDGWIRVNGLPHETKFGPIMKAQWIMILLMILLVARVVLTQYVYPRPNLNNINNNNYQPYVYNQPVIPSKSPTDDVQVVPVVPAAAPETAETVVRIDSRNLRVLDVPRPPLVYNPYICSCTYWSLQCC
ncbi:hypothetical protein BV898_02007 [Hypsibius exemplaris]|uniref:Uncharacterized protein n=1 Tax=Hypsibius exemplaris TaxID=2072580 RepID=A0A1W0X9R3_HYPEX|nr:hypothetical protein BV898_02007 [Hypsibius exemplaris]